MKRIFINSTEYTIPEIHTERISDSALKDIQDEACDRAYNTNTCAFPACDSCILNSKISDFREFYISYIVKHFK